MKKLRMFLSLAFIGITSIVVTSCGKLSIKDYSIIHEPEFGGIYITMTIDEFNKLGFEYGDSVDVTFTNGYKETDLPYYNGYYVDAGEKLLVGYPGYDYIKLAINYGDDYWDIAKVNENDKASISLNTKGKYKDIQETMNITYFDERIKYETDEEFANFRNIAVGNIKEGVLYRSASPCDNKHKRASYVDDLIEDASVNYIMNLADTKEKIDSYIAMDDFNSPYFLSIYERKMYFLASPPEKIMPLSMNMNYKSEEFRAKVALGFKFMEKSDGPYLIHCLEGKDRTGFVCIVIEALCGASYQEIVDDYMLTYKNYYGITETKDKKRYDILKVRNVDTMLKFIVGDENCNLAKTSFVNYAKNYLINGGMTLEEVNSLISSLTN